MKSETLAAKAVEKTLRGKVQKQTFPPLLEIPQKRGIPTFHTASTTAGYSCFWTQWLRPKPARMAPLFPGVDRMMKYEQGAIKLDLFHLGFRQGSGEYGFAIGFATDKRI